MTRVAYIANARIPTEKAHGIQIMNTCAAFARGGAEVELILPRRRNLIKDDPFDFYRLEKKFSIKRLPVLDCIGILPPRLAFAIEMVTFLISVLVYVATHRGSVLYSRDEFMLFPLAFFSRRVFWETHTGSLNALARSLMRRAEGVICITNGLFELYRANGADIRRLLVSPDAVELERFDIAEDVEPRRSLGVDEKSCLVTYCGSLGLYSWKGVDVFLDASKLATEADLRFLVIGGSPEEVDKFRQRYGENVIFVGRVSHDKIPTYLKVSDILVLPNKAGDLVSERYTSPMKLFEYMASRRPIVASSLPSIREILGENDALFARPGDASDLLEKIMLSLKDKAGSQKRAESAFEKVKGYTWDARAAKILDFIKDDKYI